jgi:hypothetical protein
MRRAMGLWVKGMEKLIQVFCINGKFESPEIVSASQQDHS